MRFRTHEEAKAFVKALLAAKKAGQREFMTAKLDTVPQWTPGPDGKTPPPALNGSRITAVYLAYRKPTKHQEEAAASAKAAGMELQVIEGRLVDVREVDSDKTCQVLFTNGLRNEGGQVPFRGPNVDKGILCYLAVDEGIGEPVADIIARVPEELKAKLKAMKDGKFTVPVTPMDLAAVVARNALPPQANLTQAPATPEENRHKLK